MKIDKRVVNMLWRLTWRSREARHQEEYYVPCNIWREAAILPPGLREALGDVQADTHIHLEFDEGQLIERYDPDKIFYFPLQSFRGGRETPRLGRFYPRALLPGYSGSTVPYRCVGIEPPNFAADFNHPLAGVKLRMKAVVLGMVEKRSETGGECRDWLNLATVGPGMQARWPGVPTDFFADEPFARSNEQADTDFYERSRLVSHVDARARAAIAALYDRLLKPDMEVLDLMSSWQSHLPEAMRLRIIGLGLNEEELRRNTQLTDYIVHDLNSRPRLPFGDGVFDAVICNLSVEYLVRPFEIFAEIARILRPGGLHVQTFSHRWFPPKVIRIWTQLAEFERVGLVLEYFLCSGAFTNLETYSCRGWPRPSTDRYYPQLLHSDPVFAVWGENKG